MINWRRLRQNLPKTGQEWAQWIGYVILFVMLLVQIALGSQLHRVYDCNLRYTKAAAEDRRQFDTMFSIILDPKSTPTVRRAAAENYRDYRAAHPIGSVEEFCYGGN